LTVDFSRRRLLGDVTRLIGLAAGGASFCQGLLVRPPQAAQQPGPPGEPMIVYSREYLTLEMPMSRLTSWVTPVESFFVRNNLLMPVVKLSDWRLTIHGEVERPLTFTANEIMQLASSRVTNTIECAGNGRAYYRPTIGGVPWGRGGVGNGVFEGPRLADVLRMAGLKPTARHVAFRGLDVVPPGSQEFIRSIPLSKALDPNTLLATKMNGLPLTPEHGFPVRSLVPGWIGSASIKWLTEIRVLPHEFDGFYMNPGYRLPRAESSRGDRPQTETVSITGLRVKSIVAEPSDGAVLAQGLVTIRGASWAGESAIAKVEISIDEGRTWHVTELDKDRAKYAWRLWRYQWRPGHPGEYTILSRATDDAGLAQPIEPRWNPGGYLWNGVDRIQVRVGGA